MELNPKIGIDNLKFGMTRKEVIAVLSESDRILTSKDVVNEMITKWNSKKLRLTFYQNENDRFGYLRTINLEIEFSGKKIIGAELNFVKKEVFIDLISYREIEEYDFFTTYFN